MNIKVENQQNIKANALYEEQITTLFQYNYSNKSQKQEESINLQTLSETSLKSEEQKIIILSNTEK